MSNLLIGNIICFGGSLLLTLSGLAKKKRNFLLSQSGMSIMFITGNLFLGGLSGAIANLINLLRNLVTLKWNLNKYLKVFFIIAQIALSIVFGVSGFFMWLPVVSGCLLTWFIDTDDMVLLKYVIIIGQALWAAYDLHIKNYASFPFDIASLIANSITLYQIINAKKSDGCEVNQTN